MSSNDPLIGKKLGDYTIQGVLGQGGMARVYRGYDVKLDRYAAVKVIEPNLVASEDNEEYRDRFQREARAIARLNHSRIVGIYQFGDIDNLVYYMAMAFIEGRDLRQVLKEYIKQEKRMTNAQMTRIIRDIGEALDYAHKQGVIHRDVKPSNIMVTADGHAVLTDFGLALNAQEGTIGNTFGSVHYIAPEQAVSSAQAVGQSDLYSLGVIIYEMLTGRLPFEDVSAMSVALKHISDPPPLPSSINPKITSEVEAVIIKALDKDPQKRFQTGAELAQALEQALETSMADSADQIPAKVKTGTAVKVPEQPIILPTGDPRIRKKGALDDSPTITDSSQNRPGSLPFSPLDDEDVKTAKADARRQTGQPLSSGRGLIAGGVGLAALVIVGFILVSGILGGGAEDGDATATALALAISEEPTAQESAGSTPEPTPVSPTVSPERTPTEPRATSTSAPVAVAATNTTVPTVVLSDTPLPTIDTEPTEAPAFDTPAVTPTPTFSLTVSADEPQVILRYDGRSLVLLNRSPNQNIDILELEFVHVATTGTTIVFQASEWTTGSNNLRRVEPGDCYQVWSVNYTSLPRDEYPAENCARQGFRQTSRAFWIAAQPGAMFEVRRQGITLAVCPASVTESPDQMYCLVELRQNSGG